MKTLKNIRQTIIKEVFEQLTAEKEDVSDREFEARVAKRIREEIDLNDYIAEFTHGECQKFTHSRVKNIEHGQMLLGDRTWVQEELKSGITRGDEQEFTRNDKAKHPQLMFRWSNQFDHASAAMNNAAKTKEVLDSEVGKMMKANTKLGYYDALMLYRDQAGK